MIEGKQWPSFIIQGIILGSSIYLISHADVTNKWIFLSILAVLSLFALQTTSHRFIYLFPVIGGTNIPLRHWDTHILRMGIMISALFLYLGIRDKYSVLEAWWYILLAVIFLIVLPLLFNFCINGKILAKVEEMHKGSNIIQIPDQSSNIRGRLFFSKDRVVWVPEGKTIEQGK